MRCQHVHYEAAFGDYLRSRGFPYVSVDDTRRAIFAGTKVKSFDFLVYTPGPRHWIVDVKGRKFPYVGQDGSKGYWENWVARADLESLKEWQTVFGEEYEALFVFAYLLDCPPDRWPAVRPHSFRASYYAFLGVTLADYQQNCRPRSAAWETVAVPRATFRGIVRSIENGCAE